MVHQYFTVVGQSVKMMFVKAWSMIDLLLHRLSTSITRIRSTAFRRFEGNYVAGRLPSFLQRRYVSGDTEGGTFRKGNDLEEAGLGEACLLHYQGAAFNDQAGGGRRIYPGESPMMATINVSQAAWNLAYVLAMCLTI